ncbi:MAG: hypothetical protein V7641_1503 [Blastocatellia bacterium]
MAIRQFFRSLFSARRVGGRTDDDSLHDDAEAEKRNQIRYTRALVLQKVKTTFSNESTSCILEILDRYGVESYERERERVQIAILKLSEGELEKLAAYVKVAKEDYRDALAYAEYPQELQSETWKMNAQTVEEIRQKDKTQYLDWLNGNDL